jgi:hypothetical protein
VSFFEFKFSRQNPWTHEASLCIVPLFYSSSPTPRNTNPPKESQKETFVIPTVPYTKKKALKLSQQLFYFLIFDDIIYQQIKIIVVIIIRIHKNTA